MQTPRSAEAKAFEALAHGAEEALSELFLARELRQVELVKARVRRGEPIFVASPVDVEFLLITPTSIRFWV